MNFENFLKEALIQDFWNSKQVYCFRGKTYNALFFDFLWNKLYTCAVLPCPKKSLNCDAIKLSYQSILGQSVLGMSNFYWLGEVAESGKKDKFVEYILNYQGPNVISFFTTSDLKNNKNNLEIVDINSNINLKEFNLFSSFLGIKLSVKKVAVINKIFGQHEILTLDAACMLINYLELVGQSFISELPDYLTQIIGTRADLNQLSNFFFSGQQDSFFILWSELEAKYPDVFWIAFWSDQIWRAFHVVEYLNNRDFVKAKQMSYGLPFSFINKYYTGFKNYYLHELYQNLYKIDCAIKNGSNFYSLDHFYLQHYLVMSSKNKRN